MMNVNAVMLGAIAMASLVAALFFLRFWKNTRDRFFLVIEADDPLFAYDKTKAFLESLGPREVSDVPH